MPTRKLSERELLAALRAVLSIEAHTEALDIMTDIALHYIQRGLSQEGADVLCYVLRDSHTDADTRERAQDALEELATWACPRVLYDAREFATLAEFEDIVEYIYADDGWSDEISDSMDDVDTPDIDPADDEELDTPDEAGDDR